MSLNIDELLVRAKTYVEQQARTKVTKVEFVERFTLLGREDIVISVETIDKDDPEWWVVGAGTPMNLKRQSEIYWETTDINKGIYGFQIQRNTKWKDGLTDNQIDDFEKNLNSKFSKGLRNLYKTMNGLDKPGISVYGNDGTEHTFSPVYYSYPDDIEVIKEKIEWILEANNLTADKLVTDNIPKIFPVTGHRFVIRDDNNQILSMYGDDIIYWAESISKLVVNDIFDKIYNVEDFESNPANAKSVKFWLE